MSLDDQFLIIAQKAIAEAESIQCKPKEFLDGLKYMRDELTCRIDSYAEEQGLDA